VCVCVCVAGKSFFEWFTTYANELKDKVYPVFKGEILRY